MFFLILSLFAQAQLFSLEPQIRTGGGVSWSDGSLGVNLSIETRITHLMYASIGGFRSLSEVELEPTEEDPQSWIALRHAIWAAPSFRVPHRYRKRGIEWDILLNAGFGITFSDVAKEEDWFAFEPAGLGGVDIILFSNKISTKISAKAFVYSGYLPEFREKYLLIRPQAAFEVLYQW